MKTQSIKQSIKQSISMLTCALLLCLFTTLSFAGNAFAIPATVHQGQDCFAFAGSDFVQGKISISGNDVLCADNNTPTNMNISITTDECKIQLQSGQVVPLGNATANLEDLGFIQCSYVIPFAPIGTSSSTPMSQSMNVAS